MAWTETKYESAGPIGIDMFWDSADRIDDNRIIGANRDGSSIDLVVWDYATKTFGAATNIPDAESDAYVIMLTTSLGILIYRKAGPFRVRAQRFTVSGTTVTLAGSATTVHTGVGAIFDGFPGKISPTKIGVCWTDQGTSPDSAQMVILSDLDTTITVNATATITPSDTMGEFKGRTIVQSFDETSGMFFWGGRRSGGNGQDARAALWTINASNAITFYGEDQIITECGAGMNYSGYQRRTAEEIVICIGVTEDPLTLVTCDFIGQYIVKVKKTSPTTWSFTKTEQKFLSYGGSIGDNTLTLAGVPNLLNIERDFIAQTGNNGGDLGFSVVDFSSNANEGLVVVETIRAPISATLDPFAPQYLTNTRVAAPGRSDILGGDWPMHIFEFTDGNLPGVWQGGLNLFNLEFQDTWQYAAVGTHTANDTMLFLSSYSSYGFTYWLGFNHVEVDEATLEEIANFITYNGNTYAAVYYMELYANVRGVTWV